MFIDDTTIQILDPNFRIPGESNLEVLVIRRRI